MNAPDLDPGPMSPTVREIKIDGITFWTLRRVTTTIRYGMALAFAAGVGAGLLLGLL